MYALTTSPQYPFFQVSSTPKEEHLTNLIWPQGVHCGTLVPRTANSSPGLGWVYSLTKPVGGGSSVLLTQRVGVLVSVQTFPFSSLWRASSVGKLHFPTPLHSPAFEPFLGHSQENNLVLTTLLTFYSVCFFVPSFLHSTNTPALFVLEVEDAKKDRTCPCLQRALSWNILAALPFPAPQAQTQLRPPGRPQPRVLRPG